MTHLLRPSFRTLAILLSCACAVPALAELRGTPMSERLQLRKLTSFLNGRAPTREEYAALASSGNKTRFLDTKAEELLADARFADKIVFNLSELFQIRTNNYDPRFRDMLTGTFHELVTKDLSWDSLLVGREYSSAGMDPQTDFSFFDIRNLLLRDRVFLANYIEYVPAESTRPIPPLVANFQNDDRFAGALTTARFYDRYGNTALNKNRRRAAAVFRIFLCDSMAAAVPEPEGQLDKILETIYPDPKLVRDRLKGELTDVEDVHGAQKDCMACHYKLDPMGRTFSMVGVAMPILKVRGALVYQTRAKELVNIPVESIGDMGRAMTSQRDYVDCQISHFWRWFIGKDVKLTPERLAFLRARFEFVGRKPRAFVRELIAQPEFRELAPLPSEAQSQALQAKALLQKCDSCHDARGGVETEDGRPVPQLTAWPIGGNAASMATWLRYEVARVTDLTGKLGRRSMPPRRSPWQPTPEDLQHLKRWVEAGAPGENGQPQIEARPL